MSWGGAPSLVRAGAVLVAAGKGSRLGLDEGLPKALFELCARPLATYSLAVLERCPLIESIVMVAPPGYADRFRVELVERRGLAKVSAVVEGGATRQESVRLGLEALEVGLDPVVVHDAARPLLTEDLLVHCLSKAIAFGACVPGTPISGTVKAVTSDGLVAETLDRESLREIQTPQAFKASIIRKAHRQAKEKSLHATDDSALVEATKVSVAVIQGDPENIKITQPIDVELATVIISRRAAGGPV